MTYLYHSLVNCALDIMSFIDSPLTGELEKNKENQPLLFNEFQTDSHVL